MTSVASPAVDRLDPDARAVLDLAAASGRPPLHLLGVEGARAAVRASQQLLGKTPPPSKRNDITIAGPDGPIPVRVYRPSMVKEDVVLPALVFLHGGGWMLGDLDYGVWFCASLAEGLRITVLSVGYRLAPEHPFPAGLDDSLAALDHVFKAAAALAIDPARIAIAGDSAGGNLAAICALHARDAGLPLRAQLLLYPVTDAAAEADSYARNAEGYGLTAAAMRWFHDAYAGENDRRDWRVSPLHADRLEGVAPALVLTCGFDPLCDEGDAYAAKLEAAGVPVKHLRYPGQVHGFLMWPKMVADSERALCRIAEELRTRLFA